MRLPRVASGSNPKGFLQPLGYPSKRAQLGAHYTSKEDILLIVEPVLMAPLRRRWQEVQAEARAKAEARDGASNPATRSRYHNELTGLLLNFSGELAQVRVLDPASGSGNFLYVALKQLLDLWKELSRLAGELGLPHLAANVAPSPEQLYGIELNPYAHELAQATVWIGYIQWLRDNGFGAPSEPILKPLHNIIQMDAILAYAENGQPVEPEWPEADVVIGNPPFLGGSKIRSELGNAYTETLFKLYEGRLPVTDLVCYWFEKARTLIELGKVKRAGFLATQGIRGGANRRALERIKESGNIFMAWSDRPWVLEGAAVRVSMIGFDDGSEKFITLDNYPVKNINSDLTAIVDLTQAHPLAENYGLGFRGNQKGGPFDIPGELAVQMINAPINPNGRSNKDVVKPWQNGLDITGRSRNMWLIDFGINMDIVDAAMYELPFEYVKSHVEPRRKHKLKWWLHERPRPEMRSIIARLKRYIVTPHVSKHRLFVWLDEEIVPDHQLIVFVRDDDYFFGALHSIPHELWALRQGTALEDRPRYTPSTTFETFPFPWPPGHEPKDDPRVQAIAQAAQELVQKRDTWLNPPDAPEAELKKRTLTNLYNQRPTWLALAHEKLDRAVFTAYTWPYPLPDEEILERLLALNLERAKGQGTVTRTAAEEEESE